MVTRVCVSVYLSAAACLHYCTDPDVTWENGIGMPPSCALLGGFAIGARVAFLWQHNANPTRDMIDDIVRTRNVSECSVLALCLVGTAKGGHIAQSSRRSRSR